MLRLPRFYHMVPWCQQCLGSSVLVLLRVQRLRGSPAYRLPYITVPAILPACRCSRFGSWFRCGSSEGAYCLYTWVCIRLWGSPGLIWCSSPYPATYTHLYITVPAFCSVLVVVRGFLVSTNGSTRLLPLVLGSLVSLVLVGLFCWFSCGSAAHWFATRIMGSVFVLVLYIIASGWFCHISGAKPVLDSLVYYTFTTGSSALVCTALLYMHVLTPGSGFCVYHAVAQHIACWPPRSALPVPVYTR